MGIALLTFSDLVADIWTPLQSLAVRWLPSHGAERRRHAGGLHYVSVRPAPHKADGPPLRVVRVVDPREPGRRGSRVVISGRMADVCAELDRLAALETAEAAFVNKLH